jgi:antitoxin component YwqK of YwqJK toxin-antitoxin module
MMEKHTKIPAAATWNAADNQWELGEKNSTGNEIGIWNNWHVEGHLCGTIDYGDGTPPFPVKCFHPDGTLSQEGNWYGGQKWLGIGFQLN